MIKIDDFVGAIVPDRPCLNCENASDSTYIATRTLAGDRGRSPLRGMCAKCKIFVIGMGASWGGGGITARLTSACTALF